MLRAFVATVLAALCLSGSSAQSDDIPTLDVNPVCHEIAMQGELEAGLQQTSFQQCEQSEQATRDEIKKQWISLNENNPDLKAILPWTRTNKSPETIARLFKAITETWETKDFEVRDIVEQGDNVAFFGVFTYRGRETGREVTSPFSLFAKLTNGKISYLQFLEDTFATSRTVNPKH